MLVEEIGMFGSTRTNLCGSVLVADRCLWIGEFQPWWIGAWIVACDRESRERVSDGEWRERVSNHEWRERIEINNNKKSEENDYLNKIDGRIDKLMWVFCKNGCVK